MICSGAHWVNPFSSSTKGCETSSLFKWLRSIIEETVKEPVKVLNLTLSPTELAEKAEAYLHNLVGNYKVVPSSRAVFAPVHNGVKRATSFT